LNTPFAIPRTLSERNFTAGDNHEVTGGGVESDTSREVSAIMAVIGPLHREIERRELVEHEAEVVKRRRELLAA
jgi:hypothetical protein